jgi:cholesterol transport system auxiliary component
MTLDTATRINRSRPGPKPHSQFLWLPVLLLLGIALGTGCSFKKPHPARQTFLLETGRSSGLPVHDAAPAILRVRPASVTAPFDDKAFVYRDTDLGYETDFYHQFLVPPRVLLTEVTRQWLSDSGLFLSVLDSSSRVAPTHTLESNVTALYGDYRNPAAPQAVLALRFHLLRETATGPQVQFHRAYHEAIPIERPGAESLARSWSLALERILIAFESDLANLDLYPTPR